MIPGSNLLNRASKLISLQPVDYYKDMGRTLNDIGLDVTTFASPVPVPGSVQAVPLNAYKELGLDLAKNYVTLYTNTPLLGVQRDVTGDMFKFAGRLYQCMSTTDWLAMDGWNSVLAVYVGEEDPITGNFVITPPLDYVILPS